MDAQLPLATPIGHWKVFGPRHCWPVCLPNNMAMSVGFLWHSDENKDDTKVTKNFFSKQPHAKIPQKYTCIFIKAHTDFPCHFLIRYLCSWKNDLRIYDMNKKIGDVIFQTQTTYLHSRQT